MGIFKTWLLGKKTKYVGAEIPTALYHALETVVHIHNNNRESEDEYEINKDYIITIALAEYMQKNLYTNSIEDVRVVTQYRKKEKSFNVIDGRNG